MDRQGAGGRGHRVIRIGPEGDGDGMAAHSRELGRIGRQAVVQNLPVHGAGHNGIERRINLAVGLALGIGNHCRGSRMHRQGAGGRGHRVVRVRAGGHRDRMAAHSRELRGFGRHGVVKHIPIHGPGHNSVQRRVDLAVVLALRIRGDRGGCRMDRQGAGGRGDRVVRVGPEGHGHRMAAHSRELRGIGRQCVVQNVAIHGPGHNSVERGIDLAIALGLWIGRDGGRCGMHSKGAGGRGDRVVRVGAQGHGDRMAAHSGELRGIGRQGVVEHIPIDGAGHDGIQRGVNLAVALGLRIGRDGGCSGIHRQRAGRRRDGVVRIQTCCDGDRIGTGTGGGSGCGGQGVVQNVAVDCAGHSRIQGGIGFTVGLALRIGHNGGRLGTDRQNSIRRGDRVVRI